MKTKLYVIEEPNQIIFSGRVSNTLSLFDTDQIIHIEFMERASSLDTIIYVAFILLREDE